MEGLRQEVEMMLDAINADNFDGLDVEGRPTAARWVAWERAAIAAGLIDQPIILYAIDNGSLAGIRHLKRHSYPMHRLLEGGSTSLLDYAMELHSAERNPVLKSKLAQIVEYLRQTCKVKNVDQDVRTEFLIRTSYPRRGNGDEVYEGMYTLLGNDRRGQL